MGKSLHLQLNLALDGIHDTANAITGKVADSRELTDKDLDEIERNIADCTKCLAEYRRLQQKGAA